MLESLDAVLEVELEGGLLVLLVLSKDLSVLAAAFPNAVGGAVETFRKGCTFSSDLTFETGDGLIDEVIDPLLDVVNDGLGVVVFVSASSVGFGFGVRAYFMDLSFVGRSGKSRRYVRTWVGRPVGRWARGVGGKPFTLRR